MIYTSVNNPKIKEIKKLKQKKYRDQKGLFLVEGEHLVTEAYKTNSLKELILLENENSKLKVNTIHVSAKVMNTLTDLTTRTKMIGICQKQNPKIKEESLLILDNIQDPGNLGTIIRSAAAFDINTIILDECTDVYSSKTIRASQGMIFHTNIITNKIKEIIPKLKEKGYKIYGTKVDGGKELKEIKKSQKFAIIMGNEGNGVKKEILNDCDEYIYIKMNKNCESLNVAIATSIILYELRWKNAIHR